MSFNSRHGTLLVMALAGIAVCALLIVQTRTQKMEKQKSERNQATSRPPALPELRDPRLVIRKKARVLELYDGANLVKAYSVVFGFAPEGDKEKEGDGKTPEGEFYIFGKNPQSKFHLSLGLSYPSKEDAARGLASGIITRPVHDSIARAIDGKKMPPQNTALGGEIYIHGGGVASDWTWGCIAMSNEDVEELYHATRVGATVVIHP